MLDYEVYIIPPVEEESNHMTLKGLMLAYDYNHIRSELDEYYTDYDCKLIANKMKTFAINREVEYLMSKYDYNFQQSIDKLVDTGILKLW